MAVSVGGATAHRLDIQGFRGVAVLLVVAFHARIGPRGGFVGVDIFFVISGFVIGRRLIDEQLRTGAVRLRSFFARRVRRLLPAMAFFTVVTAVASAFVLSPFGDQQRALSTGTAATVFLANLQLYRTTGYFDGSADRNPYLHTWSLSLEEQFYAMLPVLLLAIWWFAGRRHRHGRAETDREHRTRRSALIAIVALGVVSLLGSVALTSGLISLDLEAPARLVFFSMPTRVWQLAAGVVLALVGTSVSRAGPNVNRLLGSIGLVAVLAASIALDPIAPQMSGWTLIAVVGAAAVIAAGSCEGPTTRLLCSAPLVWMGDRSYGWYLWHWPFVVFAGVLWPGQPYVLVVAAAASLVPTELSYRLVERRFRFGPQWAGPRTAGLAAVCILVPLLVLGGLRIGADRRWGLSEPSDWYDLPPTQGTDCHLINRDADNSFDVDTCSFGPEPSSAKGTALLLGDGLANSVGPGVIDAAAARGWRTVQWSREGCPLVKGAPGSHYPRCEEWQADALDLVETLRPEVVVLANQKLDEEQRAALPSTLEVLDERADRVVMVAPIADFGDRFPRHRVSVIDPEPEMPSLSREQVDERRAPVTELLEELDARRRDVAMIDPLDRLCDSACRPERDGRWLYLEAGQLTAMGARHLSDDLQRALETG